jgi:hypothetical protein
MKSNLVQENIGIVLMDFLKFYGRVCEVSRFSSLIKHDYVIDMFLIFRPIASRNNDVRTRLYPIRLKKFSDSTRQ